MPSKLTLEDLAKQFQLWRNNKSHKLEPIPQQLKQLVQAVHIHYSKHQIVKALKITYTMLYNITTNLNHNSSNNTSNNANNLYVPSDKQYNDNHIDFIPFQITNSPSTNKLNPESTTTSCEIIKPNGFKLIVHTQDPVSIINTFLCSN